MGEAKAWTIFCGLVIVVASLVSGDYDGHDSEMLEGPRVERMHSDTSNGCVGSNCLIQSSEGAVGAMWFGPRLGRRRRSDIKYSAKEIEALGEVLGLPGLSFINIPDAEDKHRETSFTPRVGHELEDTLLIRNLLHKLLNRIDEQTFEEKDQTSPPIFSSRINLNHITPRLDHDFRDMLRKLQPQML